MSNTDSSTTTTSSSSDSSSSNKKTATAVSAVMVALVVVGLAALFIWLFVFKIPSDQEANECNPLTDKNCVCEPSNSHYAQCCYPFEDENCACKEGNVHYLQCCDPTYDKNCLCSPGDPTCCDPLTDAGCECTTENIYYKTCCDPSTDPDCPAGITSITISGNNQIIIGQVYVLDANGQNISRVGSVSQSSTYQDFYYPHKYQAENAISGTTETNSATKEGLAGTWQLKFSSAIRVQQVSIVMIRCPTNAKVTIVDNSSSTSIIETLQSGTTTTVLFDTDIPLPLPTNQCINGGNVYGGYCFNNPYAYPQYWNNCQTYDNSYKVNDKNKNYCENDIGPGWTLYEVTDSNELSWIWDCRINRPRYYKGICHYGNQDICNPYKNYGTRFLLYPAGTTEFLSTDQHAVLTINDKSLEDPDSWLRVYPSSNTINYKKVFEFNDGMLQEAISGFNAGYYSSDDRILQLRPNKNFKTVFVDQQLLPIDSLPSETTSFYIRTNNNAGTDNYWNIANDDHVIAEASAITK